MFASWCKGEAFASLGMNACMPMIANASPLLFQKTKLLPLFYFCGLSMVISLIFANITSMYSSSCALLRKNILPTRQQNQQHRVLQNRYGSFLKKTQATRCQLQENPGMHRVAISCMNVFGKLP